MNDTTLRTIVAAMETEYRPSTFGMGTSSSSSQHALSWDEEHPAFVLGSWYAPGMGTSWNRTRHPCAPEVAADILDLFTTPKVQDHFFGNYYTEEMYDVLYVCGDQLVSFHRHGARRNGLTFLYLSSFSFRFYSPDYAVQEVYLRPALTSRLLARANAKEHPPLASLIREAA